MSVFGVVWYVFSRIRIEYGEILRISLHSVQMREIRARKNPNTNTLHAVMAIRHVFRTLSHISDEDFFEKRDYFQIPVSGHRGNFKNLQGVLIPPSAFSQTFMPAVYEQELWVNTSLILYWVKFWNLFLKTPKVSEKLSLNCLLIACQGILPWSRFDTENKNSCR